MGRYKIQDIIPPEKRKRAKSATTARTVNEIHRGAGLDERETEATSEMLTRETRSHKEQKERETTVVDRAARTGRTHEEDAFFPSSRTRADHVRKAAPLRPVKEPKDGELVVSSPLVANNALSDSRPTSEASDRDADFLDSYEEKEDVSVDRPMYAPSEIPDEHTRHFAYEEDDRGARARIFPGKASMLRFVVGIVVLLAVGATLAHTVFSHATITVVPRSEDTNLDAPFSAAKSPEAGALGFAVMKVELTETKEIPASGSKEVTKKASGKIIVYNNHSAKTQRLIKNTRFQSPSGKIYRINQNIDVPGTKISGGKTTPGSIETVVYADEPGPEYNSAVTDFTIPGFLGDPRHETIYARSVTELSGGARGTIKTVSSADLARAKEDMRISLETKLRAKAHADIAPGQIAFDAGVRITLDEPELPEDEGAVAEDRAIVRQHGTLYATVFDRALLATAIAKKAIPSYNGENVDVPNMDALSFEIPIMGGEELWSADRIDFTLQGNTTVRFSVDENAIRRDLAGLERSRFNALMAAYPALDIASASIFPTWKNVFPTDPDDIRVVINDAK